MGGQLIIFYTLPINSEDSDSFTIVPNDIVTQEYVTPCCEWNYYIGHIAMLEGRLLMVDGGPNVRESF